MSGNEEQTRRPLADTETGVDWARKLSPGTLLAGRYRIVSVLGMGGMGVVYRAWDEELDADVAVKVLRPDLGTDPELVERFRRELLLARQVSHRNVVRIHDIGESDGLRFMTMRYVEGRSLLQVLEKEGRLSPERAVHIVRQLALALQHAHEAGVVHRDLKPGNVLLEADDTAYITDFGVARSLAGDGLTRVGAVVGTPDYLSPEQVCGEPVDGRSDLYALGIVFYEMLTGELPFRGDSQAEVVAQRIVGRVRDLRDVGVEVPAFVQRVIRRCLERSPSRRYASGAEIVADLDRRQAARRLPRWPAAAGLALILLVSAGLWWRRTAHRPAPAAAPAAHVPARALAVLPLVDETGESALAWSGRGTAEMLAADLSESADLRVVESLRVFRTLQDVGLAAGRYDDRDLRRLAELLGVDTLITGTVRRAGATLRADLRLVSVDQAGMLAARNVNAEESGDAAIFRLVASLGKGLRGELGTAATAGKEIPRAETGSLEAAKAYREGRDRLLVGDYVGAAPSFEKAVAADPSFAVALERLSETYQNLGYGEKALAAAESAARIVGDSPSRLGYRVRGRLAMLRGDPQTAEKCYAELLRGHPHDADGLLDLAAAQDAQGNTGKAIETLKKATELDASDPRAWFLLGKNAILMGDAGRAVGDYLVRALTLQNRLGNAQGQGDVLNAIGAAHHELGEYPLAIEKYTAAAAIRRRLDDRRGLAVTLKNRARTYLAMGRYSEAEPDLRAGREIYEAIGDRAGVADVMNDSGALYEGRGDYDKALAAYQGSLKVRRDLGDEAQLAQSYDNVGYLYFLQGEYEHAQVYWQQALQLHKKVGEKGGIVLSTQNLGFLQIAQGRWAEALKSFGDALEGSREIDFKSAMAVSIGNIGLLHQLEGRYLSALQAYEEALGILKALEDRRGLTEFTLKQAGALLEVGKWDEARASLDAAEAHLHETGNREQASDHQALLGHWLLQRGDGSAARQAFARAVEQARASRSRVVLLRAQLSATAAEPPGRSAAELARALKEAEGLGEALLVIRSAEALAHAELVRRRLAEAEAASQKAIRLAERCGWYGGLYRLQALRARILAARGDAPGADAAYQEAARGVARIREGLDGRDLRRSFDALGLVAEVEARASRKAQAAGS